MSIFNLTEKDGQRKVKLYPYMNEYTSFLKKMERPLIGREDELQSLLAAMERPELCNAILLADAGCGKANAVSSILPVADERGYIRLGDVKIGDMVFNEDGVPVQVIGVFHQGKLHAYRVHFEDGSSVVCNDEHLWAARTKKEMKKGKPFHVYTLRIMMKKGKDAHWSVPCNCAVQRPKADLPVDPFVLGVFLCGGGIKDDHVVLRTKNASCARKTAGMIGAMACMDSQEKDVWYFVKNGANGFMGLWDIFPVDMDDILQQNAIPDAYMFASAKQREQLIGGMLASAGVPKGVDLWFCTYSDRLASDFSEICRSCGFRTFTDYNKIPSENGRMYTYSVLMGEKSCASDLRITEIEDMGYDEEMLCIYVDCPSHLFQIGKEYIVTHNTALVQGLKLRDSKRAYLEVDLPRMIANIKNENEMADKLKHLFAEVAMYRKNEGNEVVLFIDEFHQIVQLSPAAVEVLKPLLADSGTRGIRVIAATTYREFQQYISSNQPLVERLQRINLPEPPKEVVVKILRGMAERYGVGGQFKTDAMFEQIYEYTNRYIPANAQPRKSILMMDAMIGWHRTTKHPIDIRMLADVIYKTEGVNIAFRVDATKIKEQLDMVVLSQDLATTAVADRLQICCADLNNKERPMSSFLFTGSTGVGKQVSDNEPIPIYDPEGKVFYKRNGDLQVGDYVFDREGKPTKVVGVFPQGVKDVYEVEFVDGRVLRVGDGHLWKYKSAYGNGARDWKIVDTATLMKKYENKSYNKGRSMHNIKFVIPMNQAVRYPERVLSADPYLVGVAIGNGCLTMPAFTISSNDLFVIEELQRIMGAESYYKDLSSYSYHFHTGKRVGNGMECFRTNDVLGCDAVMLSGCLSGDKFIPDAYQTASVEQRWSLIQGMFDTDGSICDGDGRYNVSYSTVSKRLAYNLQHVLYSLGISSSVSCHSREGKSDEYDVHVKCNAEDKVRFFRIPRKRDRALDAVKAVCNKKRVKKFGEVLGIRDIRKLDEKESMTCIMVDNDEHLYQAGQYIVTHNTELSKQLAQLLFDNDRSLIRFDMTEYARPDSLERFREELTRRVWEHPYCILLLDEIEKSCAEITRILLQVLDDGRLINKDNQEISFKNTYIIITTNAGSEIYETIGNYSVDNTGSGKVMKKYISLIKESIQSTTGSGKFPPELLGRIDCLVPFQPLSEQTKARICMMKLQKLSNEIAHKHHVRVAYDNRLVRYIVQEHLTDKASDGGARGVASCIEREVTTAISQFINSNPGVRDGRQIYVQVEGEMAVDNKTQLESEARIVVSERKLSTFETMGLP